MTLRSFIFSIALLMAVPFASCKVQAQGAGAATTQDKKAQKLYEEGMKCLDERKYACVEEKLTKAIDRDANFIEAHSLLAAAYAMQGKDDLAMGSLSKAVEINPRFSSGNAFLLARFQMLKGKYEDAKKNYNLYLSFRTTNAQDKAVAQADLKNIDFAIEAMKNPKPFKPVNMGPNINSPEAEYFPSITADGQLFLLTRRIKDPNAVYGYQEDFFVSLKREGQWIPARGVGNPINTPDNEGAPSLTADGQLMIFTACENFGDYGMGRQGYGSCDIFYSQRHGDNWTRPQNLGQKINSGHWETQPSFSSDGRTLYFVRGINNRNTGTKDQDIYMAQLQDDGSWGQAVKLSDKVNTPGREESVFIHPDNQTLYFSSDGHLGMGGLDIFMSKRQPDGEWGPAINLGYPINTWDDENSLLVGPDGNIAYFASDREGGLGDLDLYQFELPQDVRPEKITYMKGKVYDARTKKPLAAGFELIDLETKLTVVNSTSNPGNGEFLVTLPANKDYALNVSRPGYAFYSENFSLKGVADISKPYLMDVPLQPLDTGVIVVLKNVFFETGKFDLKKESQAELDELAAFLMKNATIKGELSGHTDNVGDDKSNLLLSQNRAKSVYEYLVAKGVPKERLTYKGYGETKPIKTNDTPEGRAENRRTEFKITSK